jgi:poly-gamma-glutamate synthesis protein (capsule biosynthesis protein)
MINWHNGSSEVEVWSRPHLRLLFAGDWAPVRAFAKPMLEQPGQLYCEQLKQAFARADLRAVNVECVLAAEAAQLTAVAKEGPPLRGDGAAIADLKALRTDVALLANNHIRDYGAEGLVATRKALENAGIACCGTGANQQDAYNAHIALHNGIAVAIVNFQEGEEGPFTERAPEVAGWDLPRVRAEIARHKAAGRTVIAVPHADKEFLPLPAPYAQAAYRSLIDAGAGAVIAHHPHVPRGIEYYNNAPIFYSTGNFAFWQEHPGIMRKRGYLVDIGVAADGSIGWQLIPYAIAATGITALEPAERQRFLSLLATVSNLDTTTVRQAWQAAIDAIPQQEWLRSCTGMDYTFSLMQQRDRIGLARLRTRLSAPAHVEFMLDGINRVLDGQHGRSDPHLQELVKLWTDASSY